MLHLSMLDISQIRNECPACENIIHFNNAGCSLSPLPVTDAIIEHLKLEQQLGGYEAAEAAADKIENFYHALATLLNCDPTEIAYLENSTRAWDMALHSIELQAGDQIITGDMEYVSNYLGLLRLAKLKQIEIKVVPSDSIGQIDLDLLRKAITDRTRLIALTHVASQRGDIQPAQTVGKIAREYEIFYLLDACQSVGQINLDIAEIGCDFLCGSGRKYLRGPRGTGFLYVRKSRLQQLNPIFVDLHAACWNDPEHYQWRADAKHFENWERYVAGQIGLGVAADYANSIGLDAIRARVEALANRLQQRLRAIHGISVHERSDELSGIVTFNQQDEDAIRLRRRLHAKNINISVAKQANARLDLAQSGVGDVNRASVHYFNTEAEIDRFVQTVAQS